jgi:isoaspartyl peptidase/L-asparaginase-like protein (Ntn-hydrolase superfamily)
LRIALGIAVFAVATSAVAGSDPCSTAGRYTILVHGGYVSQALDNWTSAGVVQLTQDIVTRARADLAAGGHALDVVVLAIAAFEDSGLADAGKGSFVNSAGFVETDASVMVGATGRSGAVAAMQTLKNPIIAARLVMEKTPHVLFVGGAGEETLLRLGAERVPDPKTYFTPIPWPDAGRTSHGTVGAVALDRCGVLAAGTSTGGTFNKMPGRVGDSPIIGASTFADDRLALSATGAGEYFIKRGATRDIAARVRYLGMSLEEAADYVVKELIGREDGSRGAVIAISVDGEIVLSSTGFGALHGYATERIAPRVGIEVD